MSSISTLRVELNTKLPLVPGFHFPRPSKDLLWVSIKYERLANYCTLCGLIGHKKLSCPALMLPIPHEKYGVSLKATTFSSPRVVFVPQQEDSNSGISLEGTTHTTLVSSATTVQGGESSQVQLVPRPTSASLTPHVPMDHSESFGISTPASSALHVALMQLLSTPFGSQSSTSSSSWNLLAVT